MPVIVACYKWVADEEGVRIEDDLSVDFSHARGKISSFDRSAIEAAMRIAETTGDSAVTLTYGTEDAEKSIKDALSRGPEKGYWIGSEAAVSADGRSTARVLAAAIESIDDVSLAVCAEGASDTYARQVGPRLGVALGWPVITSVLSFTVADGKLEAVRKLDGKLQTVRTALPAVVSVLPEGYEPRVPGLKAIMAANRKPRERMDVAGLGVDETPAAHREGLSGYAMARKNLIIAEEDPAVAAKELAAALRKEGVVQ